ncbi:MAG: hypothetical protein A2Z16_03320 [Chloroflexi bacterium RBG_16_54_18]|nr:MAG: hypothetical protein A2Z16_03320 [Chloroflexi bacterium RBG_16_54_18]
MELYGSLGSLLVDFYLFDGIVFNPTDLFPGSLKFRLSKSLQSALLLPGAIRRMRRGGDYLLSYRNMWQDFVDSIAGKKPSDFNLQDSIHAIKTSSATLESVRTGHLMYVSEAPREFTGISHMVSAAPTNPAIPPLLSAIMVAPESVQNLQQTLRHLSRQSIAHQMEIVVVLPNRESFTENDSIFSCFYGIKAVEVGKITSIARGYAAGIRNATSRLVVLTEDHSFPEARWAEALVAAHQRPFAAVGPQLRNANPDFMVSWADFYIAYGEWADQRSPISTRHLPGHNSCYKRQILLEYGNQLERMLEAESVLHWDLKQKGHQLLLETNAITHHMNFSYWRMWIPVQFHAGRTFGANRAHDWSWSRRLLFSIASPLIPFIRLRRIYFHIRRGQSLILFLKMLPALVVGLFFNAFGQMTGTLFGEGASPDKAEMYEFNRMRYIR